MCVENIKIELHEHTACESLIFAYTAHWFWKEHFPREDRTLEMRVQQDFCDKLSMALAFLLNAWRRSPLAFLEPKYVHMEVLAVHIHEKEWQWLSCGDPEDQMAGKTVFHECAPEIVVLLSCEPHSHCGKEQGGKYLSSQASVSGVVLLLHHWEFRALLEVWPNVRGWHRDASQFFRLCEHGLH